MKAQIVQAMEVLRGPFMRGVNALGGPEALFRALDGDPKALIRWFMRTDPSCQMLRAAVALALTYGLLREDRQSRQSRQNEN